MLGTYVSGLPIAEIDTKLAALKSIICDLSDCALLDYLLRADLDVERAINLHFGNTADGSASPSHIAVGNINNHNNTMQQSSNNEATEVCPCVYKVRAAHQQI